MSEMEVKTMAQKDRAKERRLNRKYGITLADRDARIAEQDHKCKICGGPLDAYGPPCVDHFHFHVKVYRVTPGDVLQNPTDRWLARGFTERDTVYCTRTARTKQGAADAVKEIMKPWSVRGMLCYKCNYGIGAMERFFAAARHPENLLPVIEYFRARLPKTS
jgi:hypothetical protein